MSSARLWSRSHCTPIAEPSGTDVPLFGSGSRVRPERQQSGAYGGDVLTAYGITVLAFMMLMHALERRHRFFVLGFTVGCALSASYGFLSGAWPFGVVEAVWCVIAARRFSSGMEIPRTSPT